MWNFSRLLGLWLVASAQTAVAGALLSDTEDASELVLLVTLSRHGSRAPNPIVKKLCPNNLPNMEAYEVPPEQLTERGMEQLEATGRHIRDVYVTQKGFLASSFNGRSHEHFEAYFRADAANRCGQSAMALGFGLYPDGTGPKGYGKQPIPVYMQLSENEHDFTAMGPCWNVMQEDGKLYSATRGTQLIQDHADVLGQAAEVCGTSFYDGHQGEGAIAAIKDVTDMFLFDQDADLAPTPGLTRELTFQLSKLSFQHLIERLYSTPRQITYVVGGFPQMLLRNLNDAAAPNFNPEEATKYYSYHGHRELLHGLGFMMGMKFHFDGLPEYNGSTPLIPGTTVFFELRKAANAGADGNTPPQHFVRLFVWSPKSPRTQVKLDNCALDCPLGEFNAILMGHIQQTGTWQDICGYHPVVLATAPQQTPVKATPPAAVGASTTTATTTLRIDNRRDDVAKKNAEPPAPSTWQWVWPSVLLVVVGTLSAIAYKRFLRRREYQPL
jgi:hypothetical protein